MKQGKMMNMKESDIEKVRLITISTQVNTLVALLSLMDRESLGAAIAAIPPENRDMMYKFLTLTLDYYDKIEEEFQQHQTENKEKENQGDLFEGFKNEHDTSNS
jgi:hypothetical protein